MASNQRVSKLFSWSRGVIADSAKGFAVHSLVDSATTLVYNPAKEFVVDAAKRIVANSSETTAAAPRIEDTPLYRSYKAYLDTHPACITSFRVDNIARDYDGAGGQRFYADVGHENMLQVLRMAKGFIVSALCLSPEKRVREVRLYVENMPGIAHAHRNSYGDGEIHLSGHFVDKVAREDRAALVYTLTGVLIHESAHIWQNNHSHIYSADPVFKGVIEGIADFIRLRAGFPARHWVRKAGGIWYAGYETTAFFFDWIDRTQDPGFVNQLNFMMTHTWHVSFFEQITGKSVDHLWRTYQASL